MGVHRESSVAYGSSRGVGGPAATVPSFMCEGDRKKGVKEEVVEVKCERRDLLVNARIRSDPQSTIGGHGT